MGSVRREAELIRRRLRTFIVRAKGAVNAAKTTIAGEEACPISGGIAESSPKRTLSEFNHYISKLRKYLIGRLFGFGATKSAFFVAKPGCQIWLEWR